MHDGLCQAMQFPVLFLSPTDALMHGAKCEVCSLQKRRELMLCVDVPHVHRLDAQTASQVTSGMYTCNPAWCRKGSSLLSCMYAHTASKPCDACLGRWDSYV